jgi:hypothetical protein
MFIIVLTLLRLRLLISPRWLEYMFSTPTPNNHTHRLWFILTQVTVAWRLAGLQS